MQKNAFRLCLHLAHRSPSSSGVRSGNRKRAREDYRAETDRMAAIFNTSKDGSGIDPALKEVLKDLIKGMKANGELEFDDKAEEELDLPEGARRAPDGNYYIGDEQSGYQRVEMQ